MRSWFTRLRVIASRLVFSGKQRRSQDARFFRSLLDRHHKTNNESNLAEWKLETKQQTNLVFVYSRLLCVVFTSHSKESSGLWKYKAQKQWGKRKNRNLIVKAQELCLVFIFQELDVIDCVANCQIVLALEIQFYCGWALKIPFFWYFEDSSEVLSTFLLA